MDFPEPSFYLLNSSDSQGSTPFDSLSSLPSEPPEIGKWFSSYVYESPELNIGDDLECSESVRLNVCEEGNDVEEETYNGIEENLRKTGKDDNLDPKGFVRCKNVIGNNNVADQVSGLTDSCLLGSEPPDIGKWFSSYVYESPELNIEKDLECGESVRLNVCEEGNDVEEETYNEIEENLRKTGKDDNLDPKGFVRCKNAIGNNNFADQVSGSTDSFLLGSEPPDIKNWFSSYAYESPAIGSSDDINFSDYKEYIFDKEGSVTEVTGASNDSKGSSKIARNDDFANEHLVSGGVKKNKRSLETNENEYAHKGENGVDKEQPSDASTEAPFTSTAELLSTKVAENSRFKELPKVAKSLIYNDELSPKMLIHQISAQRKGDTSSADDYDATEKASRSISKENDGIISAASCFISTRKNSSKRENNENSLTNNGSGQTGMLQNGARVSHDGHKKVMIQRKALSETTNILRSGAKEVTGKWRCPQKSKPNLGPPLKQLRLEQWVRRV